MKTVPEKTIQKLVKLTEQVDGKLRNDYSGRFMFGAECYGIVCKHYEANRIAKKIAGAKMDNMGLDAIVYWPRLQTKKPTY